MVIFIYLEILVLEIKNIKSYSSYTYLLNTDKDIDIQGLLILDIFRLEWISVKTMYFTFLCLF